VTDPDDATAGDGGADADDGGTNADDAGTNADDAGTNADDGGADADDGGTNADEAGTNADDAGTNGGEPTARDGGTDTGDVAPGAGARADGPDGGANHAVTGAGPVEAAVAAGGVGERLDAFRSHLTDWEETVATVVGAYAALLLLLVATGVLNTSYFLYLLSLAGMYVLLTMGLNVHWGYSGLINFAVAAFFGVGAYGAMLLSSPDSPVLGPEMAVWRWPVVGLVVGVVGGLLLALAIGIPTLSLREDYLAIATLGLAEVVRQVVLNQRDWTDGSAGLIGIDRFFANWPVVGEAATAISREAFDALTALLLVVGVWLFLRRIHRSPWGRVQRLIRTDEDLAEALGKDAFRFRMQSFLVGAAIMALAGVFYVHLNNAVFPTNLRPILTFDIWVAVILGGTGSDRGAMVGGLAMITITEGTRFVAGGLSLNLFGLVTVTVSVPVDPGPLRLLLVGGLIILLMRFRPEGLLPPQRELVWPGARGGGHDE
jgi:branched-chain amino acid transport system permease protein